MFLNALSSEDKPKFLSLLYIAAKSDGVLEECEISHISAYALEMGIENKNNDAESLEEVINHFKSRPETIRRIVIAEVLALAHIDGKFSSEEQRLIENMDEEFSLPKDFKNKILEWVNTIQPLYAKGFQLVGLV
jgi:tellurite resistance protein